MDQRLVNIEEIHSATLRAFELSAGAGYVEDICTGQQHDVRRVDKKQQLIATDEGKIDLATFHDHSHWKTVLKDGRKVLLLLVLYTIQGVPMGLGASIPFLLQGHVGYNEIGIFSLVSLPFSFKVLWAPIVDSLHFTSIGRRKSWLIPVQVICSIAMYIGGKNYIDIWMGSAASSSISLEQNKPNVSALLLFFGCLYFLMATQDVAVDGWSLTMLSEENRTLSSVCNAIGQTFGFSLSHVGFLALQDPETCNKWFRSIPSDQGIVTLGSFLQFWAFIILASTIVCTFFTEMSDKEDEAMLHLNVTNTYKLLLKMSTIAPVIRLSIVLLTCRFAFAPIDAATDLKLIEAGMKKEELAFFGPFMLPISIICPMLVGRYTSGPRPLRWFLRGWIFRLSMSFVWIGILYLTKAVRAEESSTPLWFYALLFIVSTMHTISADIMFSSQMAFFARVSDPAIGGTYMTLLNTITNIGNKWPNTLSLMTLDRFANSYVDAFVVQVLIFGALGLVWLQLCKPLVQQLESEPKCRWLIKKNK